LSGLEFVICPRCMQPLDGRQVDEDHCQLCTQPQPLEDPVLPGVDLEAQLGETERLLEQDQLAAQLAQSELEATRDDLHLAAATLEEQADASLLNPLLDAAVNAASDIERARARLRDVERFRDLWHQHDLLQAAVIENQAMIDSANEELASRQDAARRNLVRVDELSEVFDAEVRELGVGGFTGAHIDRNTFLPVVDGKDFSQLSVAGARKGLTNIAYYMSNMAYALSNPEILMPSMLQIDGPRSSLGDTPDDARAGQRIYYRLTLLAQAYPDSQIILADNGIPKLDQTTRGLLHITTLTYEQPLLRDVPHPGPGKIRTVAEMSDVSSSGGGDS
jgi:hypothetical protein